MYLLALVIILNTLILIVELLCMNMHSLNVTNKIKMDLNCGHDKQAVYELHVFHKVSDA